METQKEYAKDLAKQVRETLRMVILGSYTPKELVSTVFECFEFMG